MARRRCGSGTRCGTETKATGPGRAVQQPEDDERQREAQCVDEGEHAAPQRTAAALRCGPRENRCRRRPEARRPPTPKTKPSGMAQSTPRSIASLVSAPHAAECRTAEARSSRRPESLRTGRLPFGAATARVASMSSELVSVTVTPLLLRVHRPTGLGTCPSLTAPNRPAATRRSSSTAPRSDDRGRRKSAAAVASLRGGFRRDRHM